MMGLIVFACLSVCLCRECGIGIGICVLIIVVLLGMFNGSWNIIGEVMWWGELRDTCEPSLNAYMYFRYYL